VVKLLLLSVMTMENKNDKKNDNGRDDKFIITRRFDLPDGAVSSNVDEVINAVFDEMRKEGDKLSRLIIKVAPVRKAKIGAYIKEFIKATEYDKIAVVADETLKGFEATIKWQGESEDESGDFGDYGGYGNYGYGKGERK